MSVPEGWPEDVKYVNAILFHKGSDVVCEYALPELQLGKLEIFNVPKGHRAYPGRGVRARETLKAGEDIGYYAGFFRPVMAGPTNNGYAFAVWPPEKDLVIDATFCGNATRFINDIRNTKMDANVVAEDVIFEEQQRNGFKPRAVVFVAKVDIEAGSELLINYEAAEKGIYWTPPEVIDLTGEPVRVKREHEEVATKVSRKCRVCAVELGDGNMTASRQRSGNWICTQCDSSTRYQKPAYYLASKFQKYMKRLRKQGYGPFDSVDTNVHAVRQIMREQPLPHEAQGDVHKCCIILDDDQKPKIVLSKEAFATTRAMHTKRGREHDMGDEDDGGGKVECPECGASHDQKYSTLMCNRCKHKAYIVDPGAHLAKKFADSLRVKGVRPPYPGVAIVRELIALSTIPEDEDIHAYTIIVKDNDKPLTLENMELRKSYKRGSRSDVTKD